MVLSFRLFVTAFSIPLFTVAVVSDSSTKDECITDKPFTTITQNLNSLKLLNTNITLESLRVRSFLINRLRHWPSAIVPYKIDPTYNSWERKAIFRALDLFHKRTCIRFVPRSGEKDYVRFARSASLCSSPIGKVGGRQDILLADDCFYLPGYRGAVVHEMMHTLGFIHEHQRTDRDCYVLVTGKGLQLHDFKYILGTDTRFPYDIHSIMHYKQKPYLKGKHGERVGNFKGTLSELDVQKLNHVYCGQPHYCTLHPLECIARERATRHCRVYL